MSRSEGTRASRRIESSGEFDYLNERSPEIQQLASRLWRSFKLNQIDYDECRGGGGRQEKGSFVCLERLSFGINKFLVFRNLFKFSIILIPKEFQFARKINFIYRRNLGDFIAQAPNGGDDAPLVCLFLFLRWNENLLFLRHFNWPEPSFDNLRLLI